MKQVETCVGRRVRMDINSRSGVRVRGQSRPGTRNLSRMEGPDKVKLTELDSTVVESCLGATTHLPDRLQRGSAWSKHITIVHLLCAHAEWWVLTGTVLQCIPDIRRDDDLATERVWSLNRLYQASTLGIHDLEKTIQKRSSLCGTEMDSRSTERQE